MKGEGGVNCRLEPFRKFIQFGSVTRPLRLLLSLLLIFLNSNVEKPTLNPEITLLYQFNAKKKLI